MTWNGIDILGHCVNPIPHDFAESDTQNVRTRRQPGLRAAPAVGITPGNAMDSRTEELVGSRRPIPAMVPGCGIDAVPRRGRM